MRRRTPAPPGVPRRGSDGFNLVVLAMAVTVLNILLALALPAWSTIIQREKEEELIFRGLQYAEAVRVFQQRHNRLPTRITELIEVHPRSIRQLWKNPMAEDGSWILVPAQGQAAGQQGRGRDLTRNPENRQEARQDRQQAGNRQGQPGNPNNPRQVIRVVPPRPGEPVLSPMPNVPFIGVASPEGDSAVKTFMGSTEIREWRFTVELASSMMQGGTSTFARPVSSGNFWKPFPPGVTLPQNQQSPLPPGQLDVTGRRQTRPLQQPPQNPGNQRRKN